MSKEAIIYLNSVNNIISLIKTTKLQSNDVNIICAENEDNRAKIKKNLGNSFDIGRIPLKDEKPKLITLCTSTAYFGVDMYSDNALTFVISDCNKINTTVDISTELVQIAGRLRNINNPFRYYIYFIYNTNREELNDTDFNSMIDAKTTITLQEIESNNNAPKELKEKLIRDNKRNISIMKFEDSYTYYTGTKFAFNKMAYLNDMFVYDTQRNNYQDGIAVRKSINETRNLQTLGNQKFSTVTKQLDIITGNESFEDLMKSYCEAKENKYSFALFYIEQRNINIKYYYDILGSKRIKSLSYKESNLKNEMKNRSNDSKVIYELDKLNINTFIECSKLKLILQDIYNRLDLKKTAKATDIMEYYTNSIPVSKRVNGKKCKGYELYK